MANFKKGDRVRVVFEDEVSLVAMDGTIHLLNRHEEEDMYFSPSDPNVKAVEKIEPAPEIEVFQPGDIVQDYEWDVSPTLLVKGGYVEFYEDGSPPEFFPYSEDVPEGHFTSQRFERVGRVDSPR